MPYSRILLQPRYRTLPKPRRCLAAAKTCSTRERIWDLLRFLERNALNLNSSHEHIWTHALQMVVVHELDDALAIGCYAHIGECNPDAGHT